MLIFDITYYFTYAFKSATGLSINFKIKWIYINLFHSLFFYFINVKLNKLRLFNFFAMHVELCPFTATLSEVFLLLLLLSSMMEIVKIK